MGGLTKWGPKNNLGLIRHKNHMIKWIINKITLLDCNTVLSALGKAPLTYTRDVIIINLLKLRENALSII